MKKRKIQIVLLDILYEGGTGAVRSFTKMEHAAWKKSNDFRNVLVAKKLAAISIEIKMPNK